MPVVQLAPHLSIGATRIANELGAELVGIDEQLAAIGHQKLEYSRSRAVVDDHARLRWLGTTAASTAVIFITVLLVFFLVELESRLVALLLFVLNKWGEDLVPQGSLAGAFAADYGDEQIRTDVPAGLNAGGDVCTRSRRPSREHVGNAVLVRRVGRLSERLPIRFKLWREEVWESDR